MRPVSTSLAAASLATLALGACRPVAPAEPPAASDPARADARPDDAGPRLRHGVALDSLFGGVPGAFVVLDPARADTLRYGDTGVRSLPASTYKIPHTLLALASGVAPDTLFAFGYDARRDPPAAWWPADWARDQTLATAFRRSAVWAYQDLARRLGRGRAQAWLDTLGYGNRQIGPRDDAYWLDGSLTISPDEQVRFIDRLFAHRLPATRAQQDAVVALMTLDAGPGWTVYGKTGTGGDAAAVSWLVGAVRRGAAVYPYVLRIRPRTDAEAWSRPERLARAERMLRAVGVLP